MSNPPPGLGGGGGLRGPPPGFGSPAPTNNGQGRQDTGGGGTATIVRAQIVFLLTTFTEDTFEKASQEIRTVSRYSPSSSVMSSRMDTSRMDTIRPIRNAGLLQRREGRRRVQQLNPFIPTFPLLRQSSP